MENVFSEVKIVTIPKFKIAKYIVISKSPEDDAYAYMDKWCESCGLNQVMGYVKRKIGWDFPTSKEQSEKFGLHGYVAAYIIPDDFEPSTGEAVIEYINEDTYATLTITNPMLKPWEYIPTGYDKLLKLAIPKTLSWKERVFDSWNGRITFEEIYTKDGIEYMDIFMPIKTL